MENITNRLKIAKAFGKILFEGALDFGKMLCESVLALGKVALIIFGSAIPPVILMAVLELFNDKFLPLKKIEKPSPTLLQIFLQPLKDSNFVHSLVFWLIFVVSVVFGLFIVNILHKKFFKEPAMPAWYYMSLMGIVLVFVVSLLPKDSADSLSSFASLTTPVILLFWNTLKNGFLKMRNNENKSNFQNQPDPMEKSQNSEVAPTAPSTTDTDTPVNSKISVTKYSDSAMHHRTPLRYKSHR